MSTQWRFKEFLDEHNLKPAAVAQAAEGQLSRNSVYTLARGAEAVRFETLDVLLPVLSKLTGSNVEVSDLIAYEEEFEFGVEPVPEVILERIRRVERGEAHFTPWADVKATQRAKRGL